jgi:hypothetical protein
VKLDLCLSPCTSISSKWIKDLNIRSKTLKLVQERAGNTLEAVGTGKEFFSRTPATQQSRERMGNLTKDVNDLYKENYKLLKKEIEEDYRK